MILPYTFICPFCEKERVTYADIDRVKLVKAGMDISTVFPPHLFTDNYREIFQTSICSECFPKQLDGEPVIPYDAEVGSRFVHDVEMRVKQMYENAERE